MTCERLPLSLHLSDPDATDALGDFFAGHLRAGDTLLLSGDIGAGKSHLSRAIIRRRQALHGVPVEDVPSPTYTLVQTYPCGDTEIWHADLYRLTSPDEVFELGLDTAFDDAICLVEWPDRLGPDAPTDALSIQLSEDGTGRRADLAGASEKWRPLLDTLAAKFGGQS